MITRMTRTLPLASLLLILATTILPAATPSTAPKLGDMAASFNLGFANAFDDDFEDLEPLLTGTFEYYTTPRISWRGLLGIASFDADLPGSASVDFVFLNGNVGYNWEHDSLHPYVTGGLGIYQKNASSDLPSDFDETVLGVNGGGGLDWFLGTRWALKFEGTLHGLTGEEPDTIFMGTAGFKFWF